MKKSFLVLSALLTLVVSGICLQSCSSEYEEYSTEEYGFYTEEEITEMKAIAEKYNTDINVDENYFGRKASLVEFENAVIQFLNFSGDYQLVESIDNDGYCLLKKSSDLSRTKARIAELPRNGQITVGTIYPRRPYNTCTIYLSWTLPSDPHEGSLTLSASSPFQLYGNNLSVISGTVTPYYVSIHENITISYYGINCGRYCVSGTHHAAGESKFTITEVP